MWVKPKSNGLALRLQYVYSGVRTKHLRAVQRTKIHCPEALENLGDYENCSANLVPQRTPFRLWAGARAVLAPVYSLLVSLQMVHAWLDVLSMQTDVQLTSTPGHSVSDIDRLTLGQVERGGGRAWRQGITNQDNYRALWFGLC
ncbi:hypothetical protein RRG08_018994 [Elysia crispata]|uniref:Uncharacterized protein n=1 Tax=Elysia crispata TaxID=231223 RepID=A0AAE1A5K9_9GAST|nr:hypothetical protein RRG08_018994 [Elysia crispata]